VIAEHFSEGNSFLHTLDPRLKVCAVFPLSFIIALSDKFTVVGIGVAVAFTLMVFAKLRLKRIIGRLRALFFFLIFMRLVLPFSIQGRAVWAIGPFAISLEGIQKALMISMKSVTVMLCIISLLGTSTIFDLVHALRHLHVPKKLVYLAFLSYRYIHLLHDEYIRLTNAMIIRCFQPKTNPHVYKALSYVVGLLFIRSHDRSERIYRAMLCRGFSGDFYLLDHFSISRKDFIFSSFMAVYLIGLVWAQWIQ
jgi:cobalt/nickel transport system permease protein